MKGFVGWLKQQPQYSDLVQDAGRVGSLKGLIAAMIAHRAGDPAWAMLFDAICACPRPMAVGWDRAAFAACVPLDRRIAAAGEYANGVSAYANVMPDQEFEILREGIAALWQFDPDNAGTAIEMQPVSEQQRCLLWGLRGATVGVA